jgi:hypothetical protein
LDDKPIKSLDIPSTRGIEPPASPIPRRKKSILESNDQGTNGVEATTATTNGSLGTKRTAAEALGDDSPETKRSKTEPNGSNGTNSASANDDLILVDDSADGAIVIDDD